jgi:hypothetical protein
MFPASCSDDSLSRGDSPTWDILCLRKCLRLGPRMSRESSTGRSIPQSVYARPARSGPRAAEPQSRRAAEKGTQREEGIYFLNVCRCCKELRLCRSL